jgi:alpha-tubulin suppressor-like RCC1 family protein
MNTRRILLITVVVVMLSIIATFLLNKTEQVDQVAVGEYATFTLSNHGSIYVVGRNNTGQLATKSTSNVTAFQNVTANVTLINNERVIQIVSGVSHSAFLTSNGRVLMVGRSEYGQLARDGNTNQTTVIDITSSFELPSNEKIIQLISGKNHLFAITSKNKLFVWGRNNYGQLGNGTTNDIKTPLNITTSFSLQTGEGFKMVATSERHSIVLTTKGRIFSFGNNSYGQLGDDTTTNRLTPVEITSQIFLVNKETIQSVSAALYTTTFLTSKGRVLSSGNSVGDGTQVNRKKPVEITSYFELLSNETISYITSGGAASMAISSSGKVYGWGTNSNGQLGNGTTVKLVFPTNITARLELTGNEKVVSIQLGTLHTVIQTSHQRILAWGYNNFSQLGYSTADPTVLSIQDVTTIFNPYI